MYTFNSAWTGLLTEEVVCGLVSSLPLFSNTSSTSEKSVPVEEATGEGSTMFSGAFGEGGARCACFSVGFTLPDVSPRPRLLELGIGAYMAVIGPEITAGLGESGLSEKGENADMSALAEDGGRRGERTAIIMATYATKRRFGVRLRVVRNARSAKKTLCGNTTAPQAWSSGAINSNKADLQAEKGQLSCMN
jgi:hypothetical protein